VQRKNREKIYLPQRELAMRNSEE